MEVLRKQLIPNAGNIPGVEYDPDTDEVLYEGEPNDNFDPRVNEGYQLDTGSNAKCGAAEGMRVEIAKWVLGVVGATSVVGLANTSLNAALFLLPVSWMFGAFWAVANAALLIGAVAIGEAFTEEVLEHIRCILLSCLEPDGSITYEGLQRASTGVHQEIGGAIIPACFDLMIMSWGHVGFTNAGVLNYDPLIECDCDTCPVAYADDMTTALGWRTTLHIPQAGVPAAAWAASGGRTGGGAIWGANVAAGSYIYARVDMGEDCFIQSASIYFKKANVNRYLSLRVLVTNEAGTVVYNELVHNGTIASNGWLQYYRIIGLATGRYLWFSIFTETLGGQLLADDITAYTA